MKIFYRPEMAVDSRGYSPSAMKPKQAVEDWQKRKLNIEICSFEPVTAKELALVHDPKMVKNILAGREANGHGNKILEVSRSCLYTVGSLVAAAKAAFKDRIVCSPTSGFHHATRDSAAAFCSFNGLMVASSIVLEEEYCKRVSILDCDQHYGDGTQDIIDYYQLHDSVGHWTFGGEYSDRRNFNQKRFLNDLNEFLEFEAQAGSGLIIYQAGADPHINDPLGGTMTTEEMRERDQFVFHKAVELNLPIVYVHAGGYAKDEHGTIEPVLELHRNTAKEAILALENIAGLSER